MMRLKPDGRALPRDRSDRSQLDSPQPEWRPFHPGHSISSYSPSALFGVSVFGVDLERDLVDLAAVGAVTTRTDGLDRDR